MNWNINARYNPEMLPKVDSPYLLKQLKGFPSCTLRISSFIAGHRCSGIDTIIPAHFPTIGKGRSVKVSDLFVGAVCFNCHELLDYRDRRMFELMEKYPKEIGKRIFNSLAETQSMLVGAGFITVKRSKII